MNQRGSVVWLTGLPASGKTTLAERTRARLREQAIPCCLLDSDRVRAAIAPQPDYSEEGRRNFYATLAGLAAMLAEQGLVVVVAATANRREYRLAARDAAPRFIEVHVATGLDECQRRDPKGLYARAADGEISLPGATTDYEEPQNPDIVAAGGFDDQAVAAIVEAVAPRGH